MSTVNMSITTFKKVASKLPPTRAVLLRADHGLGKSNVVRQVSSIIRVDIKLIYPNESYEFPVLDKRAGTMSEGDTVGLPRDEMNKYKTNRITRFNPPWWYDQACCEPCMVFLDEINRGTPEVMQGFFQIILDRELDGRKLHPLTRIISAINSNSNYVVNEIDPALLDRFWTIDLVPTVEEWIEWARSTDPIHGGNLIPLIPDFIEANHGFLTPAKNADTSSVEPTPRAWDMLNESVVHAGVADAPADDMFYQIARGFVGNDVAIAFRDYCVLVDAHVTGEEVVNSYHKKPTKIKVDRQTHDRLNGVIAKVGEYVNTNVEKLNKAQKKNIHDFMEFLSKEHRIVLWSALMKNGIKNLPLTKDIHDCTKELICESFGVPLGQAGVGVIPNIPSFAEQKDKAAAAE